MKLKILTVFLLIIITGCVNPERIIVVAPPAGLSTKSEIQVLNAKLLQKLVKGIIPELPKGKSIAVINSGINYIYDDILYGELKSSGFTVKKGQEISKGNSKVDYFILAYPRAKGTTGEGFPSKNTYANMKYVFILIDAKNMNVVWSKEVTNQEMKEYDLDKVGGVFGL